MLFAVQEQERLAREKGLWREILSFVDGEGFIIGRRGGCVLYFCPFGAFPRSYEIVCHDVWARINEAGVRVATHVGPTDYQNYGADLSEDPDAVLGRFDALQWVLYWCERPAMETVTSS